VSRRRFGHSLKPLRHRAAWAGLWSLAIAVVVVASLWPAPELPQPPGGDKLHHFLGYFALAAAAVQLFARWPALFGAGLGLVLLGIGLEHAQGALTETRMTERADALANTLGVIVGLATRLTPWHDLLLRLDRADGAT
jgi:VanZ family protein